MSETALQKAEKPDPLAKIVEFVPFAAQDKIKLSISIVKNLLCLPTKSGKVCSDNDAMKYIMFCQAQKLNPFEQDSYLVGYDSEDGIAKFNMIAAEKSMLKRAELHPEFDGLQSGLTIEKEDGTFIDLEGELVPKGGAVVAGWCKVFFKQRKIPCYDRLPMDKMRRGKRGPFWDHNPEHQLVKCARAAVLRRAFSSTCGGLYLRDELDIPPNGSDGMKMLEASTPPVDAEVIPPGSGEQQKPKAASSPIEELKEKVLGDGFTFAQLNAWAQETGNFEQPAESFEKIDLATAKRLLRGWKLMKQGLEQIRDAQSNPQQGSVMSNEL